LSSHHTEGEGRGGGLVPLLPPFSLAGCLTFRGKINNINNFRLLKSRKGYTSMEKKKKEKCILLATPHGFSFMKEKKKERGLKENKLSLTLTLKNSFHSI
jgi:hypothetical protein